MGTGKSCHWSMEPPTIYGGKAISNKCVFNFFLQKMPLVSEDLHCNMELIPNCWRSHRESSFANIQLSFRNKMFGTDDLRVLDISEKIAQFPA